MKPLSNSTVVILADLLERRGPIVFGSWFQDAVAAALNTIEAHRGCYCNPGAGQPDIISGQTGFEVKTTSISSLTLDGNYQAIRPQYPKFKLVALRTDVQPFPVWVLDFPIAPPTRVTLRKEMEPRAPVDSELELQLANRLSEIIPIVGTSWSRASDRKDARTLLKKAGETLATMAK